MTSDHRRRQARESSRRPRDGFSKPEPEATTTQCQETHRPLPRTTTFKWPGSKTMLMPYILPLIPAHDCYVSVFGGSGADIFSKYHSKAEVFNDLNHVVVNFFEVLRDKRKREELTYRLAFTPHSRLVYEECQALLRKDDGDPVSLAWAFYFAAHFSYCLRDPSRSDATLVMKTRYKKWNRATEHITQIAQRFANVLLENLRCEDVLTKHDGENTFFYCDPPYVLCTRNNKEFYRHEMTDEEHLVLLEGLQTLKGRAMLSGYESDLYRKPLGNWRRVEIEKVCMMSPKKTKPMRTEVLWMNYLEDGTKIKTC